MIQPIFAYHSFKWDSDARNKAAVHCVIIGFTASNNFVHSKYIYNDNSLKAVKHISAYLTDMPMFFIKSRTKPISNVLEISYGSMGIDNKHFSLTHEDVKVLLKEDKSNIKFIRTYLGVV